MKKVLSLSFVVLAISSSINCSHTPQSDNEKQTGEIDTVVINDCQGGCDVKETYSLRIYTPLYKNIYLSKGSSIPEMLLEKSFVCAAGYSSKINAETGEAEIIGQHVTNGKLFAGKPDDHVTGYFTFSNKEYQFINSTDTAFLDSVAKNNGIAFGQDMLAQKLFRKFSRYYFEKQENFRTFANLIALRWKILRLAHPLRWAYFLWTNKE